MKKNKNYGVIVLQDKIPNELETDYSQIESIVKQIQKSSNNKGNKLILEFNEAYIQKLDELRIEGEVTPSQIYDKIKELKVIRDIYLDFLDSLLNMEVNLTDVITNLMEKVYNSLLDGYTRNTEPYWFYIWETFICSVTFLKYHEKYKELHEILSHTYFLKKNGSQLEEANYIRFYRDIGPGEVLENEYKPTTEKAKLITLTGEMLCDREKKPIYTKKSLSEADVLLYQLSECIEMFQNEGHPNTWFPISYPYFENPSNQWIKLKSRKYCEKILPLFNADSIESLKEIIKECKEDQKIKHMGVFGYAPHILSSIKIEDIGSMN